MISRKETCGAEKPVSDEDVEKLLKLAESIKYGTITLYFQDGRLVQFEKNEKLRVK